MIDGNQNLVCCRQPDRGPLSSRMDLQETWHRILATIDSNPPYSQELLYRLGAYIAKRCPRPILGSLQPADRQDALHQAVFELLEDDAGRLRGLREARHGVGTLFQRLEWRADDILRARNRTIDTDRDDESELVEGDGYDRFPDPGPSPDDQVHFARVLEFVSEHIEELGSKCRLLLYYRAKGWKPGEIARLLGEPLPNRKKTSPGTTHRQSPSPMRFAIVSRSLAPCSRITASPKMTFWAGQRKRGCEH